jgi:Rieske 2Fe-2S family protein
MQDRPALPANAFTLPARYYTDAALFEKERERFFRQMWVCVGRLEEVPAPGAYITRPVTGENILIVRQKDTAAGLPEIRAFYNVCRHRGTAVCTEHRGQLSGSIQCPYHSWTYAYDGALIGAPHMDGTPHFRKEDFPLNAVRAGVWDGYLFVSLAKTGPTLEQQLADLPTKFRPWRQGDLKVGARIEYDIAANWKLIIQNFSECLHCPNLHPVLNRLSHYMSGENEPLRPTYMGGRMDLSPGVDTMSMDGTCPRDPLPSIGGEERRRVYYYAIFPNLLLSAHPDYVMAHTLWPLAPDRTRLVCEWHFHPDEMGKPGFSTQDVTDFWDMTNKQDWFVCQLAQQGISSRGYTPGPYSNREELLYAFDRFVVATLGE